MVQNPAAPSDLLDAPANLDSRSWRTIAASTVCPSARAHGPRVRGRAGRPVRAPVVAITYQPLFLGFRYNYVNFL